MAGSHTVFYTYATYATLIQPHALQEVEGYTFMNNTADFQMAISGLNIHASERATAVSNYLVK